MRNKSFYALLLFLIGIVTEPFGYASVSNLSVVQVPGSKQVEICYDLSSSTASSAMVEVLISNDVSRVSLPTLNGHFGASVPTGSLRKIIWEGGSDLADTLTSNLSVTLLVVEPGSVDMSLIPGGTNMVSDPDFGSYSLVVDSFLMDSTEITKSLWDLVANTTASVSAGSGATKGTGHPVQDINWYECVRWCNARSSMEGLTPCYNTTTWDCDFDANGYRLPTDEEWEYAARGGTSAERFPWGNDIDHDNANYYSVQADSYDIATTFGNHPSYASNGIPFTSPGGSFDPNGYGLYDMSGNVWEWCWDSIGVGKSRRGGCWDNEAFYARSGYRDGTLNAAPPGVDNSCIGFRTVRNIEIADVASATVVFDSRDYTLMIDSAFGSPFPAVGETSFAWMSEVTCEVESAVEVGGTNYICTGWHGTGSVPASGPFNGVTILLSNLASSITWNWVSDDSDQDLMVDDWERDYFGNLDQAATNDYDGDGQDNLSEFIAGTNPTNAASLFKLSEYSVPGGFVLEWPSASNRTYNIYWTDNLVHTGFEALETNVTFPRNSSTTIPMGVQGYYRVDVRK